MRNIIDFIKESLIVEKRGVFDGAAEIAECIYDIVFVDGHSSDTVEISLDDLESKAKDLGLRLQNLFFKRISIDIDTDYSGDNISGKFNLDDSVYNPIEDLFDKISISILYDPDTIPGKSDVVDALVHELTHAYTEWNLQLKGLTMASGEKNSVKSADYYEQVTDEMTADNLGGYFFYMLYGHEKNAFFATIANKARKYNSYAVAVEELEKDKVYKEYIDLFAICKLKEDELKRKKEDLEKKKLKEKGIKVEEPEEEKPKTKHNVLDPDLDKTIVDTWRKINKRNDTDDRIWKIIIHDVYETKKKLDKIVKSQYNK